MCKVKGTYWKNEKQVQNSVVGNEEGNKPLKGHMNRQYDNIKVDLKQWISE